MASSREARVDRAFDVLGAATLLAVAAAWCVVLSTAYGGENRCDMSYMHPRFAPVPNLTLASPAHALYRYRDAREVEDADADADARACVVINVFVPGTGGGYKQARSAASGTLDGDGCRVEHYALDFAGELSAYNGLLLARQAESVGLALEGLRARERARPRRRDVAGWSVVGHSAGGLAAMDAASRPSSRALELTLVNLATPSAWNPVSSRAMGFADDWVEPGLGVSACARAASRVGVSADHRCAVWCKQLIVALSRGFAAAFPRSASLDARQRARAFRDALGASAAASAPASTFGVPARAYEATQERTLGALAGVVAHVLAPPSPSRAVAFALLAHAASPRPLRARVVESFVASLAVYVASGWLARRARGAGDDVRRPLATCAALAHVPSLIAWAQHVARGAWAHGARALTPPFGAADAVALGCVVASTRFDAVARARSRGAARARAVAWCVAAVASAPGNVGLAHVAVAVALRPATLRTATTTTRGAARATARLAWASARAAPSRSRSRRR